MLALKARIYSLLASDAALIGLINVIPTTPTRDPAIYLQHVSEVESILYPAISLFSTGGADTQIKCAEDLDLQVDIWAEREAARPGLAVGLAGAERIYRRHIRPVLHMAHARGTLNTADFTVAQCWEIPGSVGNSYEGPGRLDHYFANYRIRVIPTGAELVYPNA